MGDKRRSMDFVVNSRGRELLERCGEIGYVVLNGSKEGDREGRYTFVAMNVASVIDLGLCHSDLKGMVESVRIGN